jgi:hypothetical protein
MGSRKGAGAVQHAAERLAREFSALTPVLTGEPRRVVQDVVAQQTDPFRIDVVPTHGKPGYFVARLGGMVLCTSRSPLLKSARCLIELGHDPNTLLEMWREGATEFALRARLGAAAKLVVEETAHRPRFRHHREASPSPLKQASAAPGDEAATPLAPRLKEGPRPIHRAQRGRR